MQVTCDDPKLDSLPTSSWIFFTIDTRCSFMFRQNASTVLCLWKCWLSLLWSQKEALYTSDTQFQLWHWNQFPDESTLDWNRKWNKAIQNKLCVLSQFFFSKRNERARQKYTHDEKSHKLAQSSLFYGKHGQKPIFAEKSEKLFGVEGFWHGSVELHETQIFFFLGLMAWWSFDFIFQMKRLHPQKIFIMWNFSQKSFMGVHVNFRLKI